MNNRKRAVELFKSGYNCAQAVFAAFCDLTGIDEKTAMKMSSGFGGGMGRMRETCGAVSGMVMVLSCLYGYDCSDDYDGKKELYATVRSACRRFEKSNGSCVCRVLLGLDGGENGGNPTARTDDFYKKRHCAEYVAQCAEIIEDVIVESRS